MKKFNLIWSILWGMVSATMLFSGFILVCASAFGSKYSLFHFRIVEITFVVSVICWIGSIVFLFYDIISKKQKFYFDKKGTLPLYCVLNFVFGLVVGYVFLYTLDLFF